MTMGQEMLTVSTVVRHLRRRGVALGPEPRVELLAGGVSNAVLAVDDGERAVVVKQALGTLRVAEEWTAPRRRVLLEAGALRALGGLTPGAVPGVVDVDPESLTLVIERAPAAWTDWKRQLLRGEVDPGVATWLGRVLGTWHRATAASAGSSADVDGTADDGAETFDALRVDPYHRTVARRLVEVAPAMEALVARMTSARACLVHGDFSPKNVLVAPDGADAWVIDLEVAHRGDPAFDVAFLLSHLHLKAIALPHHAEAYDAAAREFVRGYREDGPDGWDEQHVLGHLGALLLARVHGKSPVEYLDPGGRRRAVRLGRALLLNRVSTLGDAVAVRAEG